MITALVQLKSAIALIAKRITQALAMKIEVSTMSLWKMHRFKSGEKTPTLDERFLSNLDSSV